MAVPLLIQKRMSTFATTEIEIIRNMETIKRTREEVRAAFKEYMREKKKENEAAQIRLQTYHQKRLAGVI